MSPKQTPIPLLVQVELSSLSTQNYVPRTTTDAWNR
jgi:hypothetical protein